MATADLEQTVNYHPWQCKRKIREDRSWEGEEEEWKEGQGLISSSYKVRSQKTPSMVNGKLNKSILSGHDHCTEILLK